MFTTSPHAWRAKLATRLPLLADRRALVVHAERNAVALAHLLDEGPPRVRRHDDEQETSASRAAQLARDRAVGQAGVVQRVDLRVRDARRQPPLQVPRLPEQLGQLEHELLAAVVLEGALGDVDEGDELLQLGVDRATRGVLDLLAERLGCMSLGSR